MENEVFGAGEWGGCAVGWVRWWDCGRSWKWDIWIFGGCDLVMGLLMVVMPEGDVTQMIEMRLGLGCLLRVLLSRTRSNLLAKQDRTRKHALCTGRASLKERSCKLSQLRLKFVSIKA